MNRSFKIQFHNGEADEKTIVTMSCSVNNGKRFKYLDEQGRKNLVQNIETFMRSMELFKQEVENTHNQFQNREKSN